VQIELLILDLKKDFIPRSQIEINERNIKTLVTKKNQVESNARKYTDEIVRRKHDITECDRILERLHYTILYIVNQQRYYDQIITEIAGPEHVKKLELKNS
jgi:fructose-1,6-bisphosphatase